MIRLIAISTLFSMLCMSARCAWAQGEIRSAYQRHKVAMQQYHQAYTAYGHQDIAVADSLITSALLLDPDYPEAYYLRAMIREAQDNTFAALVDYETAFQLDPDHVEARFKKAMLHYELGNYEQALADARQVLGYEKTYETTTVYYKTGANGQVTGAATLQRMEADLYNLMGLCHQGLQAHDTAIGQFEAALAINADEPQYYNNMALSWLQLRDTAAAVTTYRSGLSRVPDDQTLLFNLSRLETIHTDEYTTLYEQGSHPKLFWQRAYDKFTAADYTGALADYTTALSLDEDDPAIWLDRGRTYARLKQHSKAITDYKRALELDEHLIRGYYLLADSYQALKRYAQANDLYRYYLTQDHDNPAVHYNYAISLHLAENDQAACEHLKQAISLGFEQASSLQATFCQNP